MSNNLQKFYDVAWNKSLLVLAQMERRGILLDCSRLDTMYATALEEVAVLERTLDAWASDYVRQLNGPMNWNSTKLVAEFLFDFKGLPIPPVKGSLNATKRNSQRERTTSAAALDWLAKNTNETKGLRTFLKARGTKDLAKFMKSLPEKVSPDGRLRGSFAPTTDTGRLASSNPNLQNIPIRSDRFGIRKAFIAAPGKSLIVADYSQLEMYVLAHFLLHELNDSSLRDDLLSGDVHTNTAFRIWGSELRALGATAETIKEKPEWKRFRDNAKTVNYAIPYGKTAAGLGAQILGADGKAIGKNAAQVILDAYFSAYPGMGELFDIWRSRCADTGCTYTLLGRNRPLPEINSSNKWERYSAERRAVNTQVQGSAADIVTTAMMACVGAFPTSKSKRLCALGAELVLQVHDELVFEVNTAHAEESCAIIKDIMENPFKHPMRVQLAVDAEIGQRWGDCK